MYRLRTAVLPQQGVRAFATTLPALAVSPYSVFIKKVYKRPELKKMKPMERSKIMAHWYKNLPAANKAALAAEAKKIPFRRRKPRVENNYMIAFKKRGLSAYHKFVRKCSKDGSIMKIRDVRKRMKAIARRWKEVNPKTAQKKVVKLKVATEQVVQKVAAPKKKAAEPKKEVAAPKKKASKNLVAPPKGVLKL